jgi:hypothetical protein
MLRKIWIVFGPQRDGLADRAKESGNSWNGTRLNPLAVEGKFERIRNFLATAFDCEFNRPNCATQVTQAFPQQMRKIALILVEQHHSPALVLLRSQR